MVATFFSSMGLKRRAFIFAVTVPFLIIGVVQMLSLAALGGYDTQRVVLGVIAIVPAFAVMLPGIRLGERLEQRTFQYVVLAILGLGALRLLWSAFA